MLDKIREKTTSENTIETILNKNDINWITVYTIARQTTINNYSRQFHFKLTHNNFHLNKSLTNMRILNNSLCSFCDLEEETPIHLFAQCRITVSLWESLRLLLQEVIDIPDLTPQSGILGFYEINENIIILNQILLAFKTRIYKMYESPPPGGGE